jgi:DNA-binding transcriptional ArsR family regulator
MDVASYYDDHNAIIMLRELVDRNTCRIIMSTIDLAKTASQICQESKLPISSTYKKIRKLYKAGLISIDKINIDGKGKKVLLYKSRIKSLEIILRKDGLILQFHRNNLVLESMKDSTGNDILKAQQETVQRTEK